MRLHGSSRISSLTTFESGRESAFGNSGVVLAVGPALHPFPLDLCGEVQNFPASFSSSELSAHQMAPSGASRTCGVVADSSSWTPEAYEPDVPEMSARKCNFGTFESSSFGKRQTPFRPEKGVQP